ncbi:MAG: hypothetical protein ABW298_17230 [Candidatus Binatia bacterium]
MSVAMAVLFLALLLFGVAGGTSWLGVCATFATALVSSLAGVQLFRWAIPAEPSKLSSLVFGSILGLMLGRLVMVLVGLTIGVGMDGIVFAALVLLVGAIALKRKGTAGDEIGVSQDRSDLPWLLALAAGALLTIIWPFADLGRWTEAGHRFIPHFDHDFFQHTAIVAELTRGLPPQNPYFAGEVLHYYWFYHLWPAVISILADVTARDAVILTIPIDATLFVVSLGLLFRQQTEAAMPRFLAIALGLFAYSYIGVLFLLRAAAEHGAVPARFTTGLSEFSLLSHSWFRDFLYEPHAVTALCGVVFLLFVKRSWIAQPTTKAGALIALMLGTVTATDTMLGVMAISWWGVVAVRQWLKSPGSRPSLLACAGVLTGLLAGVIWLGILPTHSGAMEIGLHRMALWAPVYLFIELGPMFLFAVVGLVIGVKNRPFRLDRRFLSCAGVWLLLGFTLIAPSAPNLVIRKSLKILQIPLLAFSAYGLAWCLEQRHRRVFYVAATMAIAPAVLTLGTDVLQYTGVLQNPELPPTYVSGEEMRVLEWIRTGTSHDAVVQSLDEVRPGRKFLDSYHSLIASIGERRTLFGDYEKPYTFQVMGAKIQARKAILERLFTATSAEELREVLEAAPLDYLYVDERKPGPTRFVRDLEASGTLRRAHCSGAVCVFRLEHPTSAANSRN